MFFQMYGLDSKPYNRTSWKWKTWNNAE